MQTGENKPTPNELQKKCIDSIEGKFLVLAGPGTGKTFTIINRIKNLVEKGVEPSKILCLTFSDAAAGEMKSRVEKELDKLSLDVNIFTYHSFCFDIIQKYPEIFEFGSNCKIVTDTISKAFIKECIEELNPVALRTEKNDPYYYIKTIKNSISEIKKNRLTKEQYLKNIKENPDWEPNLKLLEQTLEQKNKKGDTRVKTLLDNIKTAKKKIAQSIEIWDFYELYQKKMQEKNYIDFSDMINFVLEKFETSLGFLETVANNYEYILVDEYQDTNISQNAIVFNLASYLKTQNVFVVGDDDQIIYTFQGAKSDTVEKFLEKFSDTKVICLKENMRSSQKILDIARKIALQDDKRLEANPKFFQYNISKELVSKNEKYNSKNSSARLRKYFSKEQEYFEIAQEIEKIIKENPPKDKNGIVKLNEIAILAKSNAELEEFSEILKTRNIPCELKDGKDIFKIPSVCALYFYIQFLINPKLYSNRAFQLLLLPPFSINNNDYLKIYQNVSKKETIIEVLQNLSSGEFVEPQKIEKFVKTYNYLKDYKSKENIKNTILEIGAKTGIFDYYLNEDINRCENIAGLKRFVDEACHYCELYEAGFIEEFMEYLNAIKNDDEISILTDKSPVEQNAVQLCTYYSSKGREFEYVFMPTLTKDKWESSRHSMKSLIPLDIDEYKTADELKELKYSDLIKVLYVGMTRAKHTLNLSYPENIDGANKKLSGFIEKIQDDFKKEIVGEIKETDENDFWRAMTKTLIKKDYDYKKDFYSFVNLKLGDRSFSPTSINTYINCPRQYFYSYILDFEAKDLSPDALSFGSAIHGALEKIVKFALDKKEFLKKEEFISCFKDKLKNLPLSSFEQRKNLEKRGVNVLDKYYPVILNTSVFDFYKAEYPLAYELDGVKFFGIIDRIDKNKDGTCTIYDYKTGNAKKQSEVCPEGEYKNYYNQMGLYKYFFEKETGLKVSKTVFVFVEDFENNLYLDYTESEIDRIVKEFRESIDEIKNCNFAPKYDKKSCKYCRFKDFCAMDVI